MGKKIVSNFLLPLLAMIYFLLSSLTLVQGAVTLDIGDGAGIPGSDDRAVSISLTNNVNVIRTKLDACDVDGKACSDTGNPCTQNANCPTGTCELLNYLHCTGCQTTGRTSGYNCYVVEIGETGCANIELSGGTLTPGLGPILTLTYNVNATAPAGACKALNPQNVEILDENVDPLEVTATAGEFCFTCASDEECLDSLYCNGQEYCDVNGVCQHDNPCPDDGLYCNGQDFCDEMLNQCRHEATAPDTICSPQICDELDDSCYCTGDAQCIDEEYCNGGEQGCNEATGVCQPPGDPCTAPYVCDEGNDQCVLGQVTIGVGSGTGYPGSKTRYTLKYDAGSSQFHIGAILTGQQSGGRGVIKWVYLTSGSWISGNAAGQVVLEEVVPVALPEQNDYAFKDNERILDNGNPQGSAYVNGHETIEYLDGNGIVVSLYNPTHAIYGIEMEICDEGYYLKCSGLEKESAASSVLCGINELGNGCCSVVINSYFGSYIPAHSTPQPIITLHYDISRDYAPGGCRDLLPTNFQVVGKINPNNPNEPIQELWVLGESGEFCDCCRGDFICDGDVDGTDGFEFKNNFFRSNCSNSNPCKGDYDCDKDVDGSDAFKFKNQFFRPNCATPCPPGPSCNYF
jgi:hypothetical protein